MSATPKTISIMTRHFIAALILLSAFTSCDNKKSYKYVEVVEEEGLLGGSDTKEKDPKTINAATDSAAYLEAYQSFCISLKVNKDMKQSLGKVYSTPTKFKLYNDKGTDITNTVFFADKDKREKEIEENIFSMGNTIQESVDKSKKEKIESFQQTAQLSLRFRFNDPCSRKIDSLYFVAYGLGSTSYHSAGDSLQIRPGFYLITYTGKINGKSMEWSNNLMITNGHRIDTTVVIPRILKTSTFKTTKMYSFLYYYCNELANGLLIDTYSNGKMRIKGNFKGGRAISKIKYFDINGQFDFEE